MNNINNFYNSFSDYYNSLSGFYNSKQSEMNEKGKSFDNVKCNELQQIQNLESKELNKKDESEEFVLKFNGFYDDVFKKFDNLKMSKEEISTLAKDMYTLTGEVEFHGEKIANKEILKLLEILNKKIETVTEGEAKIIKEIINLSIAFASTTPVVVQNTSKGYVSKKSIEILAPLMLKKILNSMVTRGFTLSENPFLSHIITLTDFNKTSLAQKMLLLNLSNMTPSLREEVFTDKIVQLIYQQEDSELIKWMLACSGSLEQDYLNTCGVAALCQDLTTKSLILPELLVISRHLIHDIEVKSKKIPKDSKLKKYVDQRLAKQKESLKKLNQDIMNMSRPIDEKNLYALTLNWSRIMQEIGLILDPENPAHPTIKPISDQFLVSRIIMTPIVLGEHLIGNSSNPPSITMRGEGVELKDLCDSISPFYQYSSNLNLSKLQQKIIEGKKDNVTEKEEQEALMALWNTTHSQGGIYMTSASHAFYLKTLNYKDQLFFLVSDPKCRNYEVKTFSQLLDYIKNKNLTLSY